MTHSVPAFEVGGVALVLSAVARMQLAFEASASPAEQKKLLLMAGDLLDHTLPFPDLKTALAKAGSQQLPLLVEKRERIGLVPPGLWRPGRVRPNELSQVHYSGLRGLERVLKREVTQPEKLWATM